MSLLAQPLFYAIILSVIVYFYVVWVLGRHQYLGVPTLFNLAALAALGAYAGAIIGSTLSLWPHWATNMSLFTPRPVVEALSLAYLGAVIVAVLYLRKSRYPFWPTLDIITAAAGIALCLSILTALLVHWPVGWRSGLLAAAVLIWIALILLVYWRTRPGLAAGLHLAGIFAIALTAARTIPPWQGNLSSVEWVQLGLGVFLGIMIIVWRVLPKNRKNAKLPQPATTSPGGLLHYIRLKRPSVPDSSSRTKGES